MYDYNTAPFIQFIKVVYVRVRMVLFNATSSKKGKHSPEVMHNLTIYVIYNAQLLTTEDKLLYSIYTFFTLSTHFLRHVSQFFFLQGHDSLLNSTIKNTRTIHFTATHTIPHLSLPAT
jgi:hypothetical protein